MPAAPVRPAALLSQVADPGRLAAWADLLASDRDDGVLGAGVTRFAEDAEEYLARIAAELLSGSYEPGRLTPVTIPRPDGRMRTLHVPAVRDRVVERAVLAVLTPVIDPLLGRSATRTGRALAWRTPCRPSPRSGTKGCGWVARSDFHDCFGSIPVPLLRRMLSVLIEDPGLSGLIGELLGRRAAAHGAGAVVQGLPQGSPLSPLWANLVLAGFDARVARAGFPLVRYADDLAALAARPGRGLGGDARHEHAAGELGMPLATDKSAVMSFEEGFCFLGEDFGPRYPPVLAGHRVDEPDRRVVYLGRQGAHARLESGRLVVESPHDEELLNVPSGAVERIVCFGAVGISAGLRSWALATDVDLVFLSRRGSYLGHAWPAAGSQRIARLRAQLVFADDSSRWLPFARAVVSAKVRKQMRAAAAAGPPRTTPTTCWPGPGRWNSSWPCCPTAAPGTS